MVSLFPDFVWIYTKLPPFDRDAGGIGIKELVGLYEHNKDRPLIPGLLHIPDDGILRYIARAD